MCKLFYRIDTEMTTLPNEQTSINLISVERDVADGAERERGGPHETVRRAFGSRSEPRTAFDGTKVGRHRRRRHRCVRQQQGVAQA